MVRGDAIKVLANNFPKDIDLVIGEATAMLNDASPYVRAKTAEALGHVKDKKVLPLLASLLDDQAETKDGIERTDLLGETFTENHTTFGWNRVDGNALKALERASRSIAKDDKFEIGKINYKTQSEDIAEAVIAAKAWVAKYK